MKTWIVMKAILFWWCFSLKHLCRSTESFPHVRVFLHVLLCSEGINIFDSCTPWWNQHTKRQMYFVIEITWNANLPLRSCCQCFCSDVNESFICFSTMGIYDGITAWAQLFTNWNAPSCEGWSTSSKKIPPTPRLSPVITQQTLQKIKVIFYGNMLHNHEV